LNWRVKQTQNYFNEIVCSAPGGHWEIEILLFYEIIEHLYFFLIGDVI
jgi:hypothetical protein